MGGEEANRMPFDKETARRYGDRGRATQVRRRTQDDLSQYEGDPMAFMGEVLQCYNPGVARVSA